MQCVRVCVYLSWKCISITERYTIKSRIPQKCVNIRGTQLRKGYVSMKKQTHGVVNVKFSACKQQLHFKEKFKIRYTYIL
jgi:hypothetical protein